MRMRNEGAISRALIAALLAGAAPLALSAVMPAMAQESPVVRTYQIAAQPLASALTIFGQQSGLQVSVSSATAKGRTSSGVAGTLTADMALSQLLSGTGASFRFSGTDTVIISVSEGAENETGATVDGAIPLDTIDVSGNGGPHLQGPGWQPAPDEVYETPASVAHVNASTIASYGHDLNDAMRSVAGVYTWENPAQPGMAVNIRGLEGMGRVTSTIDGVRQNYRFTGHGPAGYTYVDPALLAGIDVTKGAVTTTGGAGTLSGGVNYRTLGIDDVLHAHEKTGAQISTTFGGNATSDISTMMAGGMRFDVGTNSNGGSVFGAVSGTGADDYKDGNGNIVANTWRDVNSALMKLSIAPNNEHRLDLGGILYSTDFRANFYDQSVENTTLTAKYAYTPDNDLIDLRMNASLNRTESQWETYWGGQGQEYAGRLMTNEAMGVDISNTSRWSLNGYGLTLDYGAEYYRDDFSGNTKSDANPDGISSVGGVFVQAKFTAGMFDLIPGLRYDAYSMKSSGSAGTVPDNYWTIETLGTGAIRTVFAEPNAFYFTSPDYNVTGPTVMPAPWRGDFDIDETRYELSPKITVAAKPTEWLQLYGTWEQSFRPPSLNEMFFSGEHGSGQNASFLPNPMLRPETAKGWEFGANILSNGVLVDNDAFRLKAAVYEKDVESYIFARCFDNQICWFENAPGISKLSGFEVDASYDQGDAFLAASYSNNRSDLQFGDGIGGMGMPSRLPDNYMSLTAGLRMFDRKLTLGWRMNDVSESTPIVGGSSLDTTAYRTHDLFANYQPSERLSLFANVTNLQDIQYVPAMSQDQGPGRRIFGGATLKVGDGPMFEGAETLFPYPLIGALLGSDSDANLNVDWSGIRVGIAGGYSWSNVSTDTYLVPNLWYPQSGFHVPFQDRRSYSGHVQGGYDHQFSNGVVLGIEGAAAFGDFQRSRDTIVWSGALAANGRDTRTFVDVDSEVEWSASVKGRLGYAVGRYLPFITAGMSIADYSHSFTFWDGPNAVDPARPEQPNYDYRGQRYIGWTVGAGIEYALTEKLFLKTEYSFSDFGTEFFGWKQQNDNRGRSPYDIDSQYGISLMQHDFNIGIAYRF